MLHTIRFKLLMINLTFLLAVFAIIMAILYSTSYSMLRTNEMHYNVQATDRNKEQFSFVFDSVTRAVNTMRETPQILDAFRGADAHTEEEIVQIKNTLSGVLKDIIHNSPYLSGIHVLGQENWQFFSSIPSVDESAIRASYSDMFSQPYTQRQRSFFTSDQQLAYYPGIARKVIQYVSPVYNMDNGSLMALFVLDINYNTLEEMFLSTSMGNEDKAMIVGSDGEILFNYPYNIILDSVLKDYPELLEKEETQFTGSVFGTEMLLVSSTMKHTDWHIIRMLSLSKITKNTQKLHDMSVWVIAAVVLACLVLSAVMSRLMTVNITKLVKAFHQAEGGDMSVRVHLRSRDELGRMGDSFNMMIQKLDDHMKRELEERQLKSDMELQVLQAQVNPHFLYNTLDSIKWLAMLQSVNNIAEMTTALIHLLRYNLSKEGNTVTLADEVESVKNYLCVQKYRYGDGVVLRLDTSPETMDCLMPRFMLQPLVENCILHAFAHQVTPGTITLYSRTEDKTLHIQVIDDGGGMDVEKVMAECQKGDRFKNIGVHNLQQRILINYGEPYGLRYQSDDHGTVAEITLPEEHCMETDT